MKKRVLAAFCAATMAVTGCKSMTSIALNRQPDDQLVRNCHRTSGVPIRVKVPSHLQVHVTETYILQKVNSEWKPVKLPQPLLNVQSNLRYTEKIFTVDFKRPAAGTSKYDAEFTDDQYFKKIQHEVEDRTIKETSEAIGGLIGAIARAGGGRASLAQRGSTDTDLLTGERSVAWAEFDINEPGFEESVQAFVHEHLNCCHSCENPPWDYEVHYPQGFVPNHTGVDGQAGATSMKYDLGAR